MPLLYLDPGTGSLLLYAIVGITTTVLFALRGFWYSLRSKVFMGKKGAVKELPDLVFQSEGGKYWQVFQSVLKALDKYDIKFDNDINISNAFLILLNEKEEIKIKLKKEKISLENNDIEMNEFIGNFYHEFLNLKKIV